jgi:small basic protein
MTVLAIAGLVILMGLGVFTGADIPQAIDDYAVVILAIAIMVSAFDIGYTIREGIKALGRNEEEPHG